MVVKWEYQLLRFDRDLLRDPNAVTGVLDAAGAQGWEVVSLVESWFPLPHVLLKRPKR